MPGWTASSLAPIMVGDRLKNFRKNVTDNVTRQALAAPQSTRQALAAPQSTRQALAAPQSVMGAGVTDPRLVAGAGVTDPRLVANAPVTTTSATSGNNPSFLQAGNNTINQGDMLDIISEILGLSKPDPGLVRAQIAQADQDAKRLFFQNQDTIKQRDANTQMAYLQNQIKEAAHYSGSTGKILAQRYADQARVLRNEGELNWSNMPDSSWSTPRSGWTGPAMPGTWGF